MDEEYRRPDGSLDADLLLRGRRLVRRAEA
jgi:hypothetical protein